MFNLSPIPVPDLSGKTILVTGAGQGIGAQLVEILLKKGAVVFAGVFGVPLAENQKRISGATVVNLDVTHQSDVDSVVHTIMRTAGKLDVLINNAGIISTIGPIDALKSESLSEAFDVNVAGLHRMTTACLPLLKESKGVVINAGTGAATTPMEGWAAYCCSKAGAHMLTRMFDMELTKTGIQHFFIGIPPTDTDMQAKIRVAGLNPISKIAQQDLVKPAVSASVMAYLCADVARELDEVMLDVRDEQFKAMMGA